MANGGGGESNEGGGGKGDGETREKEREDIIFSSVRGKGKEHEKAIPSVNVRQPRKGWSYKESLLSQNSSGYLSYNVDTNDIIYGWKGYLATMNANNRREDMEGSDEEIIEKGGGRKKRSELKEDMATKVLKKDGGGQIELVNMTADGGSGNDPANGGKVGPENLVKHNFRIRISHANIKGYNESVAKIKEGEKKGVELKNLPGGREMVNAGERGNMPLDKAGINEYPRSFGTNNN